jgi:hypothetical protein
MTMPRYAVDFYSGYLEEVLATIGSRDVTLVERFLRLGGHTQNLLGVPDDLMVGWDKTVERMLMDPPSSLQSPSESVAIASFLVDAGQRRFRLFFDEPEPTVIQDVFAFLGHEDWGKLLLNSDVARFRSATPRMRWGFLDVSQVEQILLEAFGDESFKVAKTAAIAGRLSDYSRPDAERLLLEVGIETQNSVSHNIDYLIIGSKGTGGTKHDKVQTLQGAGHAITVLDEAGFDALIRSPRPAPQDWPAETVDVYEKIMAALRHVQAFELDLYTLTYEYDASRDLLAE